MKAITEEAGPQNTSEDANCQKDQPSVMSAQTIELQFGQVTHAGRRSRGESRGRSGEAEDTSGSELHG
jgi:hypothetical protein